MKPFWPRSLTITARFRRHPKSCRLCAEEWTTDPGLVAFNKAAALYRLGRFREAELHYRRCREDAVGARRAKLLYDLANCLVQRAGEHDAEALAEAIHLYDECRLDPNASRCFRTSLASSENPSRATSQILNRSNPDSRARLANRSHHSSVNSLLASSFESTSATSQTISFLSVYSAASKPCATKQRLASNTTERE